MVSLLCLALATLCWPATPAAKRLRTLTPTDGPSRRRLRPPRPSSVTLATTAAATGWMIAGLGGAVAAALATITIWRRWRARGDLRRGLSTIDGLTEALRSLVAGLRAGAHPAEAADSAAADAHPTAAAPMRAIAAASRLDGDVTRALANTHLLDSVLNRLSRAWTLAQRHGLPLADVLDAVGRDLDQRTRFARQVLARMAGPRASATVLALLPALGILLGEAMGADPLRYLTTPGPGQVVLIAGSTLLCAGVTWCGRLTNQVVPQ